LTLLKIDNAELAPGRERWPPKKAPRYLSGPESAWDSIFLGRLFPGCRSFSVGSFWFVFFCVPARSRFGKGRAKQKKMNEGTDQRSTLRNILTQTTSDKRREFFFKDVKKLSFLGFYFKVSF
jgi:hypothetical protein